jgi:hypothetical protein
VRAAARLAFDQRIVMLEQIADGELQILVRDRETGEVRGVRQPSFTDRISAIAELGRTAWGRRSA